MSCPMPASGPPVIDVPPAYVEHRSDASLIAQLYDGWYSQAVQAQPAAETAIMPETFAALASFTGMEREIRRLLDLEEDDEFGPVRPTAESVEVARKTLFQLAQAGFEIPRVRDAGTDHDGGLRLAWERGPKFLELVVPRGEHAAYFYYSQGEHYSLEHDLTPGAVCERFSWLSA